MNKKNQKASIARQYRRFHVGKGKFSGFQLGDIHLSINLHQSVYAGNEPALTRGGHSQWYSVESGAYLRISLLMMNNFPSHQATVHRLPFCEALPYRVGVSIWCGVGESKVGLLREPSGGRRSDRM